VNIGNEEMNYPWLDEYCLEKKGSSKEFKKEWKATRYMIGEKMLALRGNDSSGRPIVTLKLSPSDGYFLRNQYKDIVPGYYMNKDHWNSIYLDGSTPGAVVRDMIDQSYLLLFSSLTKKEQKKITECGG
jgi:predicted DNA-binding protein (MmcQ/YjbR family)